MEVNVQFDPPQIAFAPATKSTVRKPTGVWTEAELQTPAADLRWRRTRSAEPPSSSAALAG